jgi:hypothetical protein
MSIIEEIRKDHQEIMQIFDQLTNGANDKFSDLRKELIPHMKAEETEFYPKLMDKENKEDTLEGYEEHHASEMVLKELEKTKPSDERWKAKLKVLKEMVQYHIMEEESKILVTAKEMMDEKKLKDLAQKFDKKKQELRKQL